ncbi:mis18-binding protein 1 [Xiphophorus couchianus]|uniref:mis18-binding protein 1 n=1 Tax=Xiphophorus couchianus TaxID=32473 RepID=UPI00101676BB|nr:mis18-binding protein 1 [Xiphophorus couchianus]
MAFCHLLQRKDPSFQSPAKIFARLKAKVQKEAEGDKELMRQVGEQYGHGVKAGGVSRADGPGFNRDPAGFCWSEKMTEKNRFASCQTPAQAVTLSPMSSPEETVDYPISRVPLQQVSPLKDRFRGFTRRNRVLMESTSVSQLPSGVFRDQSPDDFSRIQPAGICGRSEFSMEARSLNPRSPCCGFSPIKNRLRKRKRDLNDTEDSDPPKARRRPAAFGDSVKSNPCRPVWGNLKIFPEPKEPGSSGLKRPAVILDTRPRMSPAKMFAVMKERERRRERQQMETCSRRDFFAGNERNLQESSDTDVSSNHYMEHMQDVRSMNTAVNQNQAESPESRSETSQDTPIPASRSPTVLLEDPLVLNTPRISMPKKDEAVFRRNVWPKQKKFPLENVIHLRNWFLRRNRKGLFVDGIHVEENIQWNSNIITERISRLVLKTVSGRVYILQGQMNIKLASSFPMKFLKKFVNGFPSNWKAIYETFLLESKEQAEKNKDAAILSKNESQLPSRHQPVRQQRRKSVKTPELLPPPSSLNVSRSGRVIKPPLKYWKGGRVILDAHMNVTIYENYETTGPDILMSTSKKPVQVLFPSSDGLKRRKSSQDEGSSVPERRLKVDRKLHRAEANRDQKTTDSTNEMISNQKAVSGRTRCKRQSPGAEKSSGSDASPKKRREPERSSKKQTQNATRPSRTSETITNPHESLPVCNNASNRLSCDYELRSTRRRRANAGRGAKGLTSSVKSEPDDEVSSSQSPEALKEKKKSRAARKREEVQKKKEESRSSKAPPPATKPGRKRQQNKTGTVVPLEKDRDEWTEDEILKLQEAVSCYPRHIMGYWAKVARMVGTRSAEECFEQHTSQGNTQSPKKSTKNCKKVKEVAAKPAEIPVISARVGTLKRIKQVRQFLENLPGEEVDDAFSSAYMQNKRMEIPSLCSSEDHDFAISDLEPQTPMSSCFPEAKTPQCSHITPGMLGSPNTKNDDKYIFQLQKRMKKNQFNVCKTSSSKTRFLPTPSTKRTVQRCSNTGKDTSFVFEMSPGDDGKSSESDEEEDFYFSDN